MLSKSAEVSDSTSALDRPIACVMRTLTIAVLISDVDTRRVRLSTLRMKIFRSEVFSSAENQKTIRTMINIDRQSLLARAGRAGLIRQYSGGVVSPVF